MQSFGNKLGFGPSDDDLRIQASQLAAQKAAAANAQPQAVSPATNFLGATSTIPLAAQSPEPTPATEGAAEDDAAKRSAEEKAAATKAALAGQGAAPGLLLPSPILPKAGAGGLGRSRDEAALNASVSQEKESARAMADLEQRRQMALQANQETLNKSQQEIWQQSQAALKANLDAQAKVVSDISSQKLNFNRFWSEGSAPQRISAAIGMILGGIGSGMTMGRQQNMAMEVIDKSIERDVEQQKAELGRKNNQLSALIEQGHSLKDAMTLTAAHDAAAAEGRMKAIANQYAGLETTPQLQASIAALEQKRIGSMQKLHQEQMDMALKGVQLKHGQMELALMGNQAAIAPIQRQIQAAASMGKGMPPQYGQFMDPARTVKLDDGLLYQAATPKDKEEMADAQQLSTQLADVANRIKSFRRQHSGGKLLPTAAAEEGKELQNEAESIIAEMSKKIRLTGQTGAELKSFITNPADFTTTDAKVEAQANSLIERAQRAVNAATRARIQNAAGMDVSSPGLDVSRAR